MKIVRALEKILSNSMYQFLEENDLLCEHQSGFRPSNSCEYHLLSIVIGIYGSFDCNPPLDVIRVFLDISLDGLMYKKIKITHIWRRWGTPQNFFLAFIGELEKQL